MSRQFRHDLEPTKLDYYERKASVLVRSVGGRLLALLERNPRRMDDVAALLGVCRMTVYRSAQWLRSCDVPIYFDRCDMHWKVGAVETGLDVTLADLVQAGLMGEGEARALALALACELPKAKRAGA